ncbi:MAG: preprotein translocase subunit SecG [Candidatus Colwellbacteria bacterium]|nr:preprotein translocase subunit SecG [Candidatus Wildermuthbacteria bacterium]MBI2594797.1 preprotein translocase subunit SecG [Candidatus Colwellbacteria bacterium]
MSLITIGQLATAFIVIILILLQERTSGAGGLFGGGGGEFYQRRRGVERILFIATIATAILFTLLSILNLLY